MLPRFKYFISLRDIVADFVRLSVSDMSDTAEVDLFKKELRDFFSRKYITTTSSYRMGVYYYLKSLNLPKGSEVLLTPITIPDLVNVILLLNLKPIFVDIDLDTHSISLEDLQRKITPNCAALILTYLSGIVSPKEDLKSLLKSSEARDIKIIEDISQAYGSRLGDDNDPFIGDIQVGSLSSGKLISCYTGGFLLTNKENIIGPINNLKDNESTPPPKRRFVFELISNFKIVLLTSKLVFPFVAFAFNILWRLRPKFMETLAKSKMYTRSEEKDIFFDDYPIRRKEIPQGWKTHLCSWQAKVGRRALKRIDSGLRKRQELGEVFFNNIAPHVSELIPKYAKEKNFNFYHLPMRIGQSKYDDLKKLFFLGIDSEGYGLNLCNEEKVFEDLSHELKGAKLVKHESVFIPLHESYSKISIEKMAKNLNRFKLEVD